MGLAETANLLVNLTLKDGLTPGAKTANTSIMTLGGTAKVAFTAIGVTASAGFALATKGAGEAEAAQGKFMAATGASREEAKQFVSGMD